MTIMLLKKSRDQGYRDGSRGRVDGRVERHGRVTVVAAANIVGGRCPWCLFICVRVDTVLVFIGRRSWCPFVICGGVVTARAVIVGRRCAWCIVLGFVFGLGSGLATAFGFGFRGLSKQFAFLVELKPIESTASATIKSKMYREKQLLEIETFVHW